MIRFASPCYVFIDRHLPHSWITALNHITLSHPQTNKGANNWQRLLMQMLRNTVVYSILSVAVIMLMLTFFLPFVRHLMPGWEMHWWANAICGTLTILLISPFLRAMVMKKNHSPEFQALWAESRLNHLPLLFTILVRVAIACMFIFYVANYLSRFSDALMLTMALALVILMILSRQLKHSSIRLERLFVQNLRSRDIEAQVQGRRRPLYEGHLLDRDVHIADMEVPADSTWGGQTLRQLALGNRFGVHVSSILRSKRRINIPDGNQVVFPSDRLQVIGSDEQLTQMGQVLEADVFTIDADLEKREMKLRQIVISGKSPFVGKTLQESGIRDRYNCMVVGLEEGKENLSSISPHRRFQKGDIIWIVGETASLDLLSDASVDIP